MIHPMQRDFGHIRGLLEEARRARDETILTHLKAGATKADIARALELSPQRVGQIVARLKLEGRLET